MSEIDFPTLITTNFGDREMEIVGDPENGVDGILTSLVRARDGDFRKKLEEALKEIEFSTPGDAPEINQLYREVDPSRIIGAWDAYFPYCVTRVKWEKRSGEEHYEETDLLEELVICAANRAFENLFDIARAGGIPDPDSRHRLTLFRLLERLGTEGYMAEDSHHRFATEQRNLFDVLMFECETDWATEPLVFDGDHFHPFYDRAKFLPAVFAKWTIGDLGTEHYDYYLIGYIRTDHNGKPPGRRSGHVRARHDDAGTPIRVDDATN